jgi:hypothetical protein
MRMGIPTASEFHRVLTPAKGELAAGRWKYAFELVVERLLNESKQTIDGLQWVERGKLLEPDAVELYESLYGQTAKCGFIMPDHKRYGCSPDRILCDDVGGVEIKAPSAAVHLAYFINGPGADYRCQVQGSLLVTDFPHWDFLSYHPQLPEALIRFERDEPFIAKLRAALDQFSDEVDGVCEKVKAAGYVPTPTHMVDAVEKAYGPSAWEGTDAIAGILAAGSFGG